MPTNAKPKRNASIIDVMGETELSEDTVRRDIDRGAPHEKVGRKIFLNVAEYVAWRESKGLKPERGRPVESTPAIESARLRKENALASKYELQVSRERGELIPVEDVRMFVGEALMVFRNNWVGFAPSIVPQLQGRDPAEQQTILESRAEELFRNLGKALTDRFGLAQVA